MTYTIVKRVFADSTEALEYASEHLCIPLSGRASGVVKSTGAQSGGRVSEEYWVFELVPVVPA